MNNTIVDEIYIDCIVKLVENSVDKICKKMIAYFGDKLEKIKINLNIAFKDYVIKSYNKYSRIKTILYKDVPQPLYDFFVCPDLFFQNELFSAQSIHNVLGVVEDARFYLIQGSGGIGKSTLLKHFFLDCLKEKYLIPVLIELKDFNRSNETLRMNIFEHLRRMGVELQDEYIEYALGSGCFIFLLDGYDELNESKQSSFFIELNDVCDRYDKNYFVLSSRPIGDEHTIALQRFVRLHTVPFSKGKAIELMEHINYDSSIKSKFIMQLKSDLYEDHKSFASNPLLLTIMLLTYDQYAEIPDKKHLFYSNAFETLYSKHDATKGGYKREMFTKVTQDIFRNVFSSMCFISYISRQYEFTIDELRQIIGKSCKNLKLSIDYDCFIRDLHTSICMLYIDGRNYKFIHRSFQEFFTACYIIGMPENIQKPVIAYILEKTNWRTDEVIGMLFDMNIGMFERSVLIPLLEEHEKSFSTINERFNHFLAWYADKVGYGDIEGDGNKTLYITHSNDKADLVCKFSGIAKMHIDDSDQENELLINYLLENTSENGDIELDIDIVIFDEKMNELIKNTWIGRKVKALMNLLVVLKDKQNQYSNGILKMLET